MSESDEELDVYAMAFQSLGLQQPGNEKFDHLGKPKRYIPDLELGLKTSFTTKQWRERERRNHEIALNTIQSPLAADIAKHQLEVERSQMLMKYGLNNKTKAMDTLQAQVQLENNLLAERLFRVQRAITEITETNLPSRNRFVKAINDRQKFLRAARENAQADMDYENSLLLKRLTIAKSSLSRKQMEDDFKRHRTIQRNMCRLSHPPNRNTKKRKQKRKGRIKQSNCGILSVEAILNGKSDRYGNSSKSLSMESHLVDEFNQLGLYNSEIAATLLRDRGQVFQYVCDIPYFSKGSQDGDEEPEMLKALVLGFKQRQTNGKPANGLVVEVSTDSLKRYAHIEMDIIRDRLVQLSTSCDSETSHTLGTVVASLLAMVGPSYEIQICLPDKDFQIDNSNENSSTVLPAVAR